MYGLVLISFENNIVNYVIYILPFQAWIYHCHLHPLQAANCFRNSRLVVDENDLNLVAMDKNVLLLLNQFHKKIL